MSIQVGTTVLLNSINKVNLAFATLLSCDPDAQVGGLRLGNQFWKVCVTYPIEEKEELIRPWGQYKALGDAKGKSIAWPSVCVCSLQHFSGSYVILHSYILAIYCYLYRLKRSMVDASFITSSRDEEAFNGLKNITVCVIVQDSKLHYCYYLSYSFLSKKKIDLMCSLYVGCCKQFIYLFPQCNAMHLYFGHRLYCVMCLICNAICPFII